MFVSGLSSPPDILDILVLKRFLNILMSQSSSESFKVFLVSKSKPSMTFRSIAK